MRQKPFPIKWLAVILVLGLLLAGIYSQREFFLQIAGRAPEPKAASSESVSASNSIEVSPKARANLGLVAKAAIPQNYWRTLEIPGVVIDRPGVTDSGVTTPIEGVVSQVHAIEGDIVEPGQKLFTIRLISDYLQKSQLDLFQAVKETEILNQEIQRLKGLVENGAVPGRKIIELEQDIKRQESLIEGQRQDLLSRGVQKDQIDQIERGKFLTSIDILAPKFKHNVDSTNSGQLDGEASTTSFYEVQALKASIGEQIKSGEVLAILGNHDLLYIKGNAFKKEASSLARAAEKSWPVEVDFAEDDSSSWPKTEQVLRIRHLANTTDPNSRTFDFFVSLKNQSRIYVKENRTFVVWRYRPGQRVRILVPVEELKDVLVVPIAAVVFEGPEAFVFQQNGDFFNRLSVQVIHQDRSRVVIANDGVIGPGFCLAQSSAAALNRILKSKSMGRSLDSSHTHADGSTHAH